MTLTKTDGPGSIDLRVVDPRLITPGVTRVFTSGVFDLLHPGHLHLLHAARALGDLLIVGINADATVRQLKGPFRPIMKASDRQLILANLRMVDYCWIFEENTPGALLAELKPEIYVKGGDYTLTDLPEAPVVQAYGGRIVLLPLWSGWNNRRWSTTELVDRIRWGNP